MSKTAHGEAKMKSYDNITVLYVRPEERSRD